MTPQQMRAALIKRFPSGAIRGQSIARMTDNQVVAIYYRLLSAKQL